MDARNELLKLILRIKPLPMAYGWSCELLKFRGGYIFYHVEKNGYHFYCDGRRETEWFCRILSGTIPEDVLATMERSLYHFSASGILDKLKAV